MTDKNKKPATKISPKKVRRALFAERKVNLAEVRLAKKVVTAIEDGVTYIRRFSVFEVIQHLLLLVSVLVLTVTGLAQTFSDTPSVATFIALVGGIDTLQSVHHIFAIALVFLFLIHILLVLDAVFVRMRHPSLVFNATDLRGIAAMLKIFFDPKATPPAFDRYKPDEKFTYWVTFGSVLISGITGLMLFFPVQATFLIPGAALPYAISIHRWQAILLTVTIGLLHSYQVLRKKNNINIFSGMVAVSEMEFEHPLELAWLRQLAKLDEDRHFPIIFNGLMEVGVQPMVGVATPEPKMDVTENVINVTNTPQNTGHDTLEEEEKDKIDINEILILQDEVAGDGDDLAINSPEEGDSMQDQLTEE